MWQSGKAVRVGDWKLVTHDRDWSDTSNWELYDMSKDRNETQDLSAQYPEKVASLFKHWNEWASDFEIKSIKKRSALKK
jgi:arylsulfatase